MENQKKSNGLNIILWVAQILLAFAFGMAGFMKLTMPMADLASKGMGFVNHFSEGMVRFIGIIEVLGVLGLILPSALKVKPILTPIAAVGFAVLMLLAIKEHISQNEPIIANIILFSLAIFTAWGRYKKHPINS